MSWNKTLSFKRVALQRQDRQTEEAGREQHAENQLNCEGERDVGNSSSPYPPGAFLRHAY
jgi:hypothetical protein